MFSRCKLLFAALIVACLTCLFLMYTLYLNSLQPKRLNTVFQSTQPTRVLNLNATRKPPLQRNDASIDDNLTTGKPIQVANLDLYILTAVYHDSLPVQNGFNVLLNGWIKNKLKTEFVCCLMRTINGTKVSAKAVTHHIDKKWIVDMQSAEFSCSLSNEELKSAGGVGFRFITFAQNSCSKAPDRMLTIVYPKRIVGSVGICPKVMYGNLDPIQLIEWFEYARIMNVTRVQAFYAEIDPKPLKVIDYYRSIGFLESYHLHVPSSKGRPKHHFTQPRYAQQAWMNEIAAINDCKLRMSGFDYVLVMDVDEYIVALDNASVLKPGDGNYLSILKKASQIYPDAGGFVFNAHVMILTWGKTRDSPLFITSYTTRTKQENLSTRGQEIRLAFMPNRTFYSRNNIIHPKKPWKTRDIPRSLCRLIHFRICKPNTWKNCEKFGRVEELSFVKYEKQLAMNLLKVPLYALTNDSSRYNKLKSWLIRENVSIPENW